MKSKISKILCITLILSTLLNTNIYAKGINFGSLSLDSISFNELQEEANKVDITDLSIDYITDSAFDLSEKYGIIIEHDNSPLMQELDLFSETLKKTVMTFDGIPDIGEHEPMFSVKLGENKIVDVVQVENKIYGIWHITGKTQALNGDAITDFLWINISKATGLK